ncbi:caspase-8 [Labrus bergylta]|uniref:Caspase-8 n=1 Tax=Labrus bergylta TaxID=56723 RepID=A0A3Q3EIJ8_9LABR|nr:caspase-8-like [Labrus bergylta]
MDRVKLSRIDEELGSSEVAALCFLCRDVVNRKHLEKVQDAKDLFLKLEEKGLLENGDFLSQLLNTIRRADLLAMLETDSRQPEETDASRRLSDYSVMLYNIHQNMTDSNFDKMSFLLSGRPDGKLDRRQIESCKTPLDVFAEMERTGLLSNQKLDVLLSVVKELDQELAQTVQLYMQGLIQPSHFSMDHQRSNDPPRPTQPSMSVSETQPGGERESVYSDANPRPQIEHPSLPDQTEYYAMNHSPRGQCVVINNKSFLKGLRTRGGSDKDEEALCQVFSQLGFTMVVHRDLTADAMQREVTKLSKRSFLEEDALVICVLSHGEKGSVYGSDEKEVYIKDLTLPFTSEKAPTLAGKPKLFFIQACQGKGYQGGAVPLPPRPRHEDGDRQSHLEEDAGPVLEETVPSDADFLLGMATVQDYKSFRHVSFGSVYIQELCRQLHKSAESSQMDNILSVLTRVNREVSKGVYLNHKQMPEPKYTLTKQLVLKYV